MSEGDTKAPSGPSLLERVASAGVTGALTTTVLTLTTDFYHFDAHPQVLDMVPSPGPLLGLGLATLAGATAPGTKTYGFLGRAVSRLGSSFKAIIQKPFLDQPPLIHEESEDDRRQHRRRAACLGYGLTLILGAVTPLALVERYGNRIRPKPFETKLDQEVQSWLTPGPTKDTWDRARIYFGNKFQIHEGMSSLEEHAHDIPLPPGAYSDNDDLDQWASSVELFYGRQCTGIPQPKQEHGNFGTFTEIFVGPAIGGGNVSFLNDRLIESDFRLADSHLRHRVVLLPSGVFVIYAISHPDNDVSSELCVTDLTRGTSYGPFSTSSPNSDEVLVQDPSAGMPSYDLRRCMTYREIASEHGPVKIQTLFQRPDGGVGYQQVPLGEPVEPTITID